MVRRLLLLAACWLGIGFAQRVGAPTGDLANVGVDELFSLEVTSVGRKAQQLSRAPAAVFVLTAEDIRRSGATSIQEALEWAPGLTVLSPDGRSWVISARGSARLYADKILVMIDGRSLYTPLFSGVTWDAINVPLAEVQRIEIVRGPGAVMWGPNAVNGVINIITKKTHSTTGGQVVVEAGNELRGAAEARWGPRRATISLTGFGARETIVRRPTRRPGCSISTPWPLRPPSIENLDEGAASVGFRMDGQPNERDQWMIQASVYKTDRQDVVGYPTLLPGYERVRGHTDYDGGFIQGSWTRTSAASESALRFSYDRSTLNYPYIGGNNSNFTIDFEKRSQTGESNEVFWGAGYQQYGDDIWSARYMALNPASAVYRSGYAVARDEFQLVPGKLLASAACEPITTHSTRWNFSRACACCTRPMRGSPRGWQFRGRCTLQTGSTGISAWITAACSSPECRWLWRSRSPALRQ